MSKGINFDALRCCSLLHGLSDESLKAMIPSFEMVELVDQIFFLIKVIMVRLFIL